MFVARMLRSLALLTRHPAEFYDRATTMVDARLDRWLRPPVYHPVGWEDAVRGIKRFFGERIDSYLTEPGLGEIEDHLREKIAAAAALAPFPAVHNGTFALGRLCYLVCRASAPAIIVETGVAFGVTTAYFLKALEVNGRGVLHSIDKPPYGAGADQFVGVLVPEPLRSHWHLHRGASQAILPGLLPQLKHVDIFLHDSRHTYRNISRELREITAYLTPQAIVLADDIERNSAFHDWALRTHPTFWVSIQQAEKNSLAGLSIRVEK